MGTGEFTERAQKRYDDTDLLLATLVEKGYSSPSGRAALRRINAMHSRYPITNDQKLYVISSFVVEPYLWNQRFGWRPYTQNEGDAGFIFWTEVGRRMGIEGMFPTFDAMLDYYEAYEEREMFYAPENRLLYDRVLPVIKRNLSPPLAMAIPVVLPAIMSARFRQAFGLEDPSKVTQSLIPPLLKTRGRLAQRLKLKPTLRLTFDRMTYPNGFRIKDLGT